jgi:hypothetical protein
MSISSKIITKPFSVLVVLQKCPITVLQFAGSTCCNQPSIAPSQNKGFLSLCVTPPFTMLQLA